MISSISAVTFEAFGNPRDVVQVSRLDLRDIRPHEVLVKTQMAPINPADLNVLEGTYAVLPETFPAIAGMESIGVIAAKGVSVPNTFKVGQQVIVPQLTGRWSEAYIAPHDSLIGIPPGIPTAQAAMISVNPPTAWRLLHDFAKLKPGDWLIQNAANSGVGRAVIQIAKSKQWKTINIVRRPELVEELKALGADIVVVHGPHMRQEILDQIGSAKVTLGLNATGGKILSDLVKHLAPGSTVVTYGAMAKQPFMLSNAHLIFRDIRACGFWITGWYRNAKGTDIQEMLLDLTGLMKSGKIHTPVEHVYSMQDIQAAIDHASRESRSGKVLIGIG
ncbi:MAG: trans-2-enoyl-CoA reductase [Kiritimatiellia bacterium]|jgi:mitochondrial enoyl-[acyl-carrier protein] reductase / trans-2-enoyl-CoA reductase